MSSSTSGFHLFSLVTLKSEAMSIYKPISRVAYVCVTEYNVISRLELLQSEEFVFDISVN